MAAKNFGTLAAFKNLVRKTLANCNELSLSSLIKTCHMKFKTTIIYFITCSVKMVRMFVMSSVARGYHEYKDVWSASINRTELPCKRELGNTRDTSAVAVTEVQGVS